MATSIVQRARFRTRIRRGIAKLLANIGRPRVSNKRAAGCEVTIPDNSMSLTSPAPGLSWVGIYEMQVTA